MIGSSVWECLSEICFRTSKDVAVVYFCSRPIEIPLEPDYKCEFLLPSLVALRGQTLHSVILYRRFLSRT